MSWSYSVDEFAYEWEGEYAPASGPSGWDGYDYTSPGEPPDYPTLVAYALVSFYKDGQKTLEVEVGEGWFHDAPDMDAHDEQRMLEEVCDDVCGALQDIDDGDSYPGDTYEGMVKDVFDSGSIYVERVAMKTADAASKSLNKLFQLMRKKTDQKLKGDWRSELKRLKKQNEKNTAKYKRGKMEKSGFSEDTVDGESAWVKPTTINGETVLQAVFDRGADGLIAVNYGLTDDGEPDFENIVSVSDSFEDVDKLTAAISGPRADKSFMSVSDFEEEYGGDDGDESHDGDDGAASDDENEQDESPEVQDEAPAEAPEGAKQCKGKTSEGEQCKNMTTNENGYCEWHQDQAGGKQSARSIEREMMRLVAECLPKHAKSAAVSEGDKFTLYDNETYIVEEVDGDAVWVRGDQGDYTNWSIDDIESWIDDGVLVKASSKKVAGGMNKKSRCQYINKDGKRCNRMVKNAAYCPQHAKMLGKTAGSANCLVQLWNLDGSLYDEHVCAYGTDMADWRWWLDNFPNMDYVDRITFKNHSTEALQGTLTIDEDMNAYYDGHPVGIAHEAARTADNYAGAPRVPDEVDIDADNVDSCPLCGDPNFDGSFCNVCGYEEPPEGFDDIDLESPADYEIYQDDFEESEEDAKPTFDPDEVRVDSEVEEKADEIVDNAPDDEDEYGVKDDDMAFA